MTDTNIEKCPWTECKSKYVEVIYHNKVTAQVVCLKCLARGPKAPSGCHAIELWNHRQWRD